MTSKPAKPNAHETHRDEVERGERFEFGANWSRYLKRLDEARVSGAIDSLCSMLVVSTLAGKTFLDAGCGSGLFSLAALRLGATVRSFDYDPRSVACAEAVKHRFAPDNSDWTIEEGSVLDKEYLATLPRFAVVYSWGVLHHTGAMWEAIDNTLKLVAPGGIFFISIYNDQGRASRQWRAVKRVYNRLPRGLKWLVLFPAFVRLWGPTFVKDTLKGAPLRTWSGYSRTGRGMSPWTDVVDWVGGYPFEVARPEEVVEFCVARGLRVRSVKTQGSGLGCNEYIFETAAG